MKRFLQKSSEALAATLPIMTALQANAADDASTLIARVLATNSPWLTPAPATGNYSLHVTWDGAADFTAGPISLTASDADFGVPPANPSRVGSIVWTPLHEMAAKTTPYTLSLAGTTNWYGSNLTIVDVSFSTNARLEIGIGGQVTGNVRHEYVAEGWSTRVARLFVETNNAIPIFIETDVPNSAPPQVSTWTFDTFFVPLGGGLVPRALDWDASGFLHTRLEFQTVGGTWIFKRGDSWWDWGRTNAPSPSPYVRTTGHVLSCELTQLSLNLPITVTRNSSNLTMHLQPQQGTGFGVVAADEILGPWVPVESQTSADNSSITVNLFSNTPARFYRLKK